jgi:hypothetical protein
MARFGTTVAFADTRFITGGMPAMTKTTKTA